MPYHTGATWRSTEVGQEVEGSRGKCKQEPLLCFFLSESQVNRLRID